MANAVKDTLWKIAADVDVTKAGSNTSKVTLNTAGTFVDRNIEVDITANATDGAIKANAPTVTAGSASMAATGFTADSATTSPYYVTLSTTKGTAKSNAGVETAGYVNTTDTDQSAAADVDVSGNGNKLYIKNGSVSATAPTVTAGSASMEATGVETASSSSHYITLSTTKGTAKSNASATEGYVAAATPQSAAADVAVSGNGDKIYIKDASFTNTASDPSTYPTIDDEFPVLISESYLFIEPGYVNKGKVSLAKLVPDGANVPAAGVNWMLKDYSAYDNDGKLIAGTIETKGKDDLQVAGATVVAMPGYYPTPTAATVAKGELSVSNSATSASVTVDPTTAFYIPSPVNQFTMSGSGSVVGTMTADVATAGYVTPSDKVTGDISGTASASVNLDIITGTTEITGDAIVTPSVMKEDFTISGVTNAADGAATTTAPKSGAYIKVKSGVRGSTITATPSITKAGYGTSDHNDIASATISVGAHASADTYVKVKDGSASVTADTISVTGGAPALNSSTNKYDIALSGSKTVGGTATAGWVSSVTGATVSASGTVSLNKATLTHNNTATATNPSVAVSGAATGVNTAASGNYYVTITGTPTAGSVTHTASVTEGYVPTAGLSQEATIPTAASVTGSGTKVYLASQSVTAPISSTATSGYTNVTFAAQSASAPQLAIKTTIDATAGNVISGKTDDTKYINIWNGSYTVG